MEYLIFDTNLKNFNIPCSNQLFQTSIITDANKKMIVENQNGIDCIKYDINIFKTIDFCGSPFLVPFYDNIIAGDEELKQFWNNNSKELAEIDLHKTYSLAIRQIYGIINNFTYDNLTHIESSIFHMNLLENRLYLNHIFDGRELTTKWMNRYQTILSHDATLKDFINWTNEINQKNIRLYFDSIKINYELHQQLVNLIEKNVERKLKNEY